MQKFTITIKRAQLRAALLFAGNKDIRYYLNGVCLHVGECGDARLVACDGHRMAVIRLDDQAGAVPGEYIIPRDIIKPIKKASRDYLENISVEIDATERRCLISDEHEIFGGSKLIDGKFPDWARVIPDAAAMDNTPGTFNAAYLADIQKALIELGSKMGFYNMRQNGERGAGLVIDRQFGFLAVIMGLRVDESLPGADDVQTFKPRSKPRAIIETAKPAENGDFPRDAGQDVTDKRAALPAPVHASASAEIAAFIDPSGALQAAGLLSVVVVADKTAAAPAPDSVDPAFAAYLESISAAGSVAA